MRRLFLFISSDRVSERTKLYGVILSHISASINGGRMPVGISLSATEIFYFKESNHKSIPKCHVDRYIMGFGLGRLRGILDFSLQR